MLLETSFRYIADDTAVITLTGALTLGTSLKTADTQIQTAIDRGVRWLVLEMSGVPYIDSAGLGALVHTAGLARQHGGAVRLSGVHERVVALLRMAHVDTMLPMDENQEIALAAMLTM